MRIQKYLSEQGILSRRKAEEFMKLGRVSVNGKQIRDLGHQIDPTKDEVKVTGLTKAIGGTTYRAYKPYGVTVEKFAAGFEAGLQPLLRLDQKSEGLMLLSNDWRLTKALTSNNRKVVQTYELTFKEDSARLLLKFTDIAKQHNPDIRITKIGDKSLRITTANKTSLKSLCDKAFLTPAKMRRIQIGELKLQGLQPGSKLKLTEEEVKKLL